MVCKHKAFKTSKVENKFNMKKQTTDNTKNVGNIFSVSIFIKYLCSSFGDSYRTRSCTMRRRRMLDLFHGMYKFQNGNIFL